MIREPRFLPETGDIYGRRVYVVRAKPALIAHLKHITSQLDTDDFEFIQRPTVVMTEQVPFEQDLEGWRPAIMNKCKEAFLRETSDYLVMSLLRPPRELFADMATLTAFFDQWWDAEEADDIEIEAGSWKTCECHPLPPQSDSDH